MNVEVNYLAILIAGVASMAVGFLWYGPLMGKAWTKEKGYTKESMEKAKKGMTQMYAITFVASLVTAYVLSHVMALSMSFFHYERLQTGLTTAFWMWLGFVLPVQLSSTIFGTKNWKLLGIDTGHYLVSLLAMGIVIGLL